MLDGSDLSLSDRLRYALGLLSPAERKERVEKSPQQLRRYLDGADPPLSVLVMISAASGVPMAWLAEGRADIPSISEEGIDAPISFGVVGGGSESAGGRRTQAQGRVQRAAPGAEASGDDFGVQEGAGGGLASERKPVGLAWQVNPERLARAYEMAQQGIVTQPGKRPDPRRLMQVMLLIYDQLTEDEEASSEGGQ